MVTQPRGGYAAALVAASLAFVVFMTLGPESQEITNSFCIFCGALGGVDFVLNVILFVPLGIGLRWTIGKTAPAVIIGALTTVVIETLQWRVISGRDASIGDVVANTLGTMLGAWLATESLHWLNATGRAARRYAANWGMLAVLVILGSAWLLQPIVPKNPQWVQWMPVRLNTEPFHGHLIALELKARTIYGVESFTPKEAFDTLTRSISVRAQIGSSAGPSRRLAIIARIANGKEEGFSLGQLGNAAVFRTYITAARLKLRPVLIRLDHAFPDSAIDWADDAFTIEGNSTTQSLAVRRTGPDGEVNVTVRRTVGLAWALLLPREVALNPRWWIVNAIWLAALVFPVSCLTIRSARSREGESGWEIAWWPLLLVLLAFISTAATGLSGLGMGEWAGVFSGIGAGWLVERWTSAPHQALKGAALGGTIPS